MLSNLKKSSDGILIKLPKKKQDLRMDLPTVGLNTFKDCKKFGLKGTVLKSKKNIFCYSFFFRIKTDSSYLSAGLRNFNSCCFCCFFSKYSLQYFSQLLELFFCRTC